MKEYPTISVCMSMYNAAPYIGDCMRSILQQTFSDFEIIIVDDGSTDNCCDIVESFVDSRITLIKSNHDFIASLNRAMSCAKGKYIARMDADDIMLPHRLDAEYKYMEEHEDVDAVAGYRNIIGKRNENACIGTATSVVSLETMLCGNVVANSTSMIRRARILEKNIEYDRNYLYAEDYNFWVDMLACGLCIHIIPKVLLDYRICDTQVTNVHYADMVVQTERIKQKISSILYSDFYDSTRIREMASRYETNVSTNNKLTVIMPFLNERNEVGNTLQSIRKTIGGNVDIIVINDNSVDDYDYEKVASDYSAFYIKNDCRIGVAACRDLGVELCKTPYFLLLDAHMRFYDKKWNSRLVQLLDNDDRVLLCCQTRFLQKDSHGKVETRRECPTTYGAVSMFQPDSYWPDICWNKYERCPNEDIEPIANVLGAGYAASCRYWKYLHGLQGLRKFGCDEALISFKVWREGGRCLLVKDVVIGHIYRDVSPFLHSSAEEVGNYLLSSFITFSQSWYCRSMAVALHMNYELYEQAMRIMRIHKEKISEYEAYMSSIYTRSFDRVLQIHRDIVFSDSQQGNEDDLYEQINQFVLSSEVNEMGIFYGNVGIFVWHCLFAKWKGIIVSHTLVWQYKRIINTIVNEENPNYGFSQGLSGIGWSLIYLSCLHVLA